ncbi:WD40-repeat-containing domain protein [Neohortaea acidophila]|uniref:WD40-repeat-containing domain protein n=1 Tax=Neohortaea acidophila TaxID=245834 RepID=A0A6A6PFC8_9PEZI|nr:WD40-repeat-containing domain protein [Neohortaea acidophila]KAF2478662.1 WD40-repeat-containing domain protein [Neohortaea acidophila]
MTASASKTHTGSSRRYTDVTGTFEDERVQLSPSAGVGARSAFSSANVPSAKRRRVDDPPAYISPSARFQERTQPVALTASQPVPVNAHSFRPTRPTQSIQPVQPTQPTQPAQPAQPTQPDVSSGRHGDVYTPAEDALLVKLKEVEGHHWNTIFSRFPNRTPGSVQVRYSAIKKRRAAEIAKPSSARSKSTTQPHAATPVLEDSDGVGRQRQRRRRNNEASVLSGFISWADLKNGRLADVDEPSSTERSSPERDYAQFVGECLHPKSLGRLLRQRELGNGLQARSIPNELKEHALKTVGPRKYYKGTSGDVVCVAWASDGNRFAAGSIALTDERSMQYNQSCNLLVGDCERSLLQELPDHHIPRPKLDPGSSNVNALHSMRETQDPRLFMTIASVQFSPDDQTLYSAGSDAKVRAYSVGPGRASLQYELEHSAPLDLISVSNSNVLATACHQAADGSIAIFNGPERVQSLSPSRMGPQTDTAIYPSALRWGTAAHHSHYLLAGFSIDSLDAERTDAGEILLWDARAEDRLKVSGDTRNVFDIAWNPNPSPASSVFAVASTRGSEKVSRGTRSVVCCYTGQGNSAAKGIAYECPASDINDVIYCQHDQNLIAAGATDGKVYVWDQRFARRDCKPLHILEHGATLNVLDHDRERELADTGVRFISWGATGSRLYTGSSDGVVKVWNPYRSTDGAHIKDVATFTSAVMSGAFSPDYRDLLIGEDQGRINWLSVGYDDRPVRSMPRFELESAPSPVVLNERDPPFVAARELLHSSQIALKPMGDLPKRQAVQGPRYQGPFLAASASELQEAQQQYYDALYRQQEAHSTASMIEPNPNDNDDNDDNEQRVQQAKKHFQEAEAKLSLVWGGIDDAATLLPQAEANQLALQCRARNCLTFDAADESCKLDCNYLPASIDVVPDSQRSESRIPAALRAIAPPLPDETTDLPHEDLVEAGYTHKCMSYSRSVSDALGGSMG